MPMSWLKVYPDITLTGQSTTTPCVWLAQRLTTLLGGERGNSTENPFCMAMHWALSASHERQVALRRGRAIHASHDEGWGAGTSHQELMPHAEAFARISGGSEP